MAYTESDRVNLRHFLGVASLYLQADPRIESAITATQSIADGGTRPDNTTETKIKALITSATSIETKLAGLWDYGEVTKAEDASLDVFRGMVMLRSEGRRLVFSIALLLGMNGPVADVFSNGAVDPSGLRTAAQRR